MGIRETLNENPRITTGITVGLIVVVLAWLLWPRGGDAGGGGGGTGVTAQTFFTTDDGKTWFADDAQKVPPFKKDNKDAVRAVVYKCGGKTFVNHLERYTAEAHQKLTAVYAKGGADANDPTMVEPLREGGLEVKAPDGKEWVKVTDPKAAAVMQPKCPDGGADLEIVVPPG